MSDMRGVALAGVLKNIYAIGLGIADGLQWGDNKKSRLVTQAIEEMAIIMQALGGKKESAFGGAGLGDLVATGYSPYSRNRRVGYELVKTRVCCLESEGSRALSVFASIARRQNLSLPFLAVLEVILIKNKDAKISFEKLFKEGRLRA
jgi:glycerol-3-phosphate dehydrogenase (NAD(P)+)